MTSFEIVIGLFVAVVARLATGRLLGLAPKQADLNDPSRMALTLSSAIVFAVRLRVGSVAASIQIDTSVGIVACLC